MLTKPFCLELAQQLFEFFSSQLHWVSPNCGVFGDRNADLLHINELKLGKYKILMPWNK